MQEIYDSLPVTAEEGTTYADTMTKLNSHFDVKENVPYERSIFRETSQTGESIDVYVTRLRKLAQYCEYGNNLDDEIRDQIITKCNSSKLRKRLLQETDLNLEKLMRIARTMEL